MGKCVHHVKERDGEIVCYVDGQICNYLNGNEDECDLFENAEERKE